MAVVVIGGHSRSVGKTSVVAGLIAALPEYSWHAMKITQFGHGGAEGSFHLLRILPAQHSRIDAKATAVFQVVISRAGFDRQRMLANNQELIETT